MRTFDASAVRSALPWPDLIDAITQALTESVENPTTGVQSPDRQSFTVPVPDADDGTLLLMPAWSPGAHVGVKAVTYFPSNAGSEVPTINAGYLLFDGGNGKLVAVFDGDELTARRTAAASALAARHLARTDARRLLIVGTGQLSSNVAQAHANVRSYDAVEVWGRSKSKAEQVVADLNRVGLTATATADLDTAVTRADVISCVTGSAEPLVKGELLQAGTHLDLIGAFKADMRESDDECVARASVFVDTRAGAVQSGDLARPLADGVMVESDIKADLGELVTASHPGRVADDEITLFKSAGFALEDLAAARLALLAGSQ